MTLTVYSPHNGQPVKVRPEDVGRAVRDAEGRIFYVLPRSDGTGHFGAMTRAGSQREEQRALELEAKLGQLREHNQQSVHAVHDATGRPRSSWRGRVVIGLLVILVLALIYLFSPVGPFSWDKLRPASVPQPNPVRMGQPTPPPDDSASP